MSLYNRKEDSNTPAFVEAGEKEFARVFALEGVTRFDRLPMLHRTTLYVHQVSVGYVAFHLAIEAKKRGIPIDPLKARRMGRYHDDTEVDPNVTDIPAPTKRAMTPEQKQVFREAEQQAAQRLVNVFIQTDSAELYIEEQEETAAKQTPEAQIVDIADKLDVIGEAIHEIRCGNELFYEVVEDSSGIVLPMLRRYPMWDIVKDEPRFDLEHLPTLVEVQRIPKVTLEDLRGEANAFWNAAMNPNVPAFYDTWRCVRRFLFHEPGAGGALFPGWNEQLRVAPQPRIF